VNGSAQASWADIANLHTRTNRSHPLALHCFPNLTERTRSRDPIEKPILLEHITLVVTPRLTTEDDTGTGCLSLLRDDDAAQSGQLVLDAIVSDNAQLAAQAYGRTPVDTHPVAKFPVRQQPIPDWPRCAHHVGNQDDPNLLRSDVDGTSASEKPNSRRGHDPSSIQTVVIYLAGVVPFCKSVIFPRWTVGYRVAELVDALVSVPVVKAVEVRNLSWEPLKEQLSEGGWKFGLHGLCRCSPCAIYFRLDWQAL
jgi:hypothetical protein